MEWEKVLIQCNDILELLDELPDAAEDFVLSVEDKVISIRNWIDVNEHVTEKQATAIENIHQGVLRWFK